MTDISGQPYMPYGIFANFAQKKLISFSEFYELKLSYS